MGLLDRMLAQLELADDGSAMATLEGELDAAQADPRWQTDPAFRAGVRRLRAMQGEHVAGRAPGAALQPEDIVKADEQIAALRLRKAFLERQAAETGDHAIGVQAAEAAKHLEAGLTQFEGLVSEFEAAGGEFDLSRLPDHPSLDDVASRHFDPEGFKFAREFDPDANWRDGAHLVDPTDPPAPAAGE